MEIDGVACRTKFALSAQPSIHVGFFDIDESLLREGFFPDHLSKLQSKLWE
jgi:hypothetical protein